MRSRCIVLVLDEYFGRRLLDLYKKNHVWIIESEMNHRFIAEVLHSASDLNDCTKDFGVTPFKLPDNLSKEQIIECGLEDIWDHHGYSESSCMQQLDVYGVEFTEFVHNELVILGFDEFTKIAGGVSARKRCL